MRAGKSAVLGAALVALSSVVGASDAPMRTLQAVKRSGIVARDEDLLRPRSNVELDYHHSDSSFEAVMKVGAFRPTVVLEHVDHLISELTCTPSGISVVFGSTDSARHAKGSWDMDEYVVITSHAGCNDDGQRVPYIVSGTSFPTGTTAFLEARPASWATVARSMKLDFGVNEESALKKRATAGEVGKKDVGDHTINWDWSNKTLPNIGSGTLTHTCLNCSGSATFFVKEGSIDIIAEFTGAIEKGIPVVSSVVNVAVGAVTTAASVVVSGATSVANDVTSAVAPVTSVGGEAATAITSVGGEAATAVTSALGEATSWLGGIFGRDTMDPSTLLNPAAKSFDIQIGMKDLDATFEFETDIQIYQEFPMHLLSSTGQGLPGFTIPNVVTIGPSVDPVVLFNFMMDQPIVLTYGFELTMPGEAVMDIDVLNPGNSQATGFDQLKATAIPLKVDAAGVGANFTVAFRPSIEIGVDCSALMINIEPVVVYADLPKYSGYISMVANSDDNCTAQDVGSNHISFESDLSIDVGLGADINVAIANIALNPSHTLTQKSSLLPFSTCFDYGAKTSTVPSDDGTASAGYPATTIASNAPYGNGTEATGHPSGSGVHATATSGHASGSGAHPAKTAPPSTNSNIAWATDLIPGGAFMPQITDIPDWASAMLKSASALDKAASVAV